MEYGIFSDESQDYTEEEAVEAGFWSPEEAQTALAERYSEEDGLAVHAVEGPEEDEEEEEDEDDEQ